MQALVIYTTPAQPVIFLFFFVNVSWFFSQSVALHLDSHFGDAKLWTLNVKICLMYYDRIVSKLYATPRAHPFHHRHFPIVSLSTWILDVFQSETSLQYKVPLSYESKLVWPASLLFGKCGLRVLFMPKISTEFWVHSLHPTKPEPHKDCHHTNTTTTLSFWSSLLKIMQKNKIKNQTSLNLAYKLGAKKW